MDERLFAGPRRKLVEVEEHVSRIFENPHRSGSLELILAVTTREKSDSKRCAARGGIHVPDAIADHVGTLGVCAEPACRLHEKVRVRFGVSHRIAGNDGRDLWVNPEALEVCLGGSHSSAGRDSPGQALLRQLLEKLDSPRQWRNVRRKLAEELGMAVAQPFQGRFVDRPAELALELRREKSAAHSDLSVDSPDGEIQPVFFERDMPGANMIVDTVDERSVEVEEKAHRRNHLFTNKIGSNPFPRLAATNLRRGIQRQMLAMDL
jgi:hypothetical protein